MSMLEHTKGVIKATLVAILIVFGLSLIIPQQIVLQHELVVNLSQDSVFSYLSDESNIRVYFPNLQGIDLEKKGEGEYVFKGHDDLLYRIELKSADRAKGVEITYFKEDEKAGVFLFTTRDQNNQTLFSQTQFWNLGYNPIMKLLGHQTKQESQDRLEDEMIAIKRIFENK